MGILLGEASKLGRQLFYVGSRLPSPAQEKSVLESRKRLTATLRPNLDCGGLELGDRPCIRHRSPRSRKKCLAQRFCDRPGLLASPRRADVTEPPSHYFVSDEVVYTRF